MNREVCLSRSRISLVNSAKNLPPIKLELFKKTVLKSEFPNVKVIYKNKDKLNPERGTMSIDKAKNLLNYDSKYPLEEGYIKYIQWYKKFASKIL